MITLIIGSLIMGKYALIETKGCKQILIGTKKDPYSLGL